MRGIVMMLAASLLVTANDVLVKLALGAAGSAEALFFRGLFALLALSSMAPSAQFGCLLTRCWQLSVGLAGLAVLELDWAWFELRDRGLLDFTVWAAGQMVDEEEMKNFDVRMLAASAVPAAVAGMIPLDTQRRSGRCRILSSKGDAER